MIRRLLIANRGEIACRIARTCRSLGIETVAVYSDADFDALHVARCDIAVNLPGNAASDTYLRIDLLLGAAAVTGADAVHPGYGFLAESDDFAAAVIEAGLTWVGPPPEAITAMGSKIAAKALMQAAGVATLPQDASSLPVLVKASAGGGGRGMRIVRDASELDEAVASARREAAAAFGDGEVFFERYVERGRHVEVQVIADTHGTVTALHERECSLQRRHQKIIEEAPSPAVDTELRARLCDAAVTAAAAVGYVGAGTVEFLLEESGQFWFLEMNTRLQVEHPVTEAITGLDLVELQLRIAEGNPLPQEAIDAPRNGHAIEARLTAEDPAAGYLPATGKLVRFDIETGAGDGGVRVDTGVRHGSVVSPYYDSMIAKVIAHGPTREAATRALRAALAAAEIAGITTNRDQLVNILDDPEFAAGRLYTGMLDENPLATPRSLPGELAASIVWFAEEASTRERPGVPVGWRNNPAIARTRTFEIDGEQIVTGGDTPAATLIAPVSLTGDLADVTVLVDGVRRSYRVVADGPQRFVNGRDGSATVVVMERHREPGSIPKHGSLAATMPGAVRRVLVAEGDTVAAGQALVVIEAMKMEHQLTAPFDGIVSAVYVAEGDQVNNGESLIVVDDAARSAVT